MKFENKKKSEMHFTENFTYFTNTTFNINHHYQALPSIIKDAFENIFYFL